MLDAAAIVGWSGVVALVVWANERFGWDDALVSSKEGLQTLLQVVPAVMVALYVFAFGSVFVIAQIVAPSRGARSVRMLVLEFRFRAMVVGALLIALMSVSLAGRIPEVWDTRPPHVAAAGAALVEVTIVIVLTFTVLLLGLFHTYTSPSRFQERLAKTSWGGDGQLVESARVVRQWLCTAARDGQSRDLIHACAAVHRIYTTYSQRILRNSAFRERAEGDGPEREAGENDSRSSRRDVAALAGKAVSQSRSYTPAREIESSTGVRPLRDEWQVGWFGMQLSKALVRATEEGVRSGVAWRNLDELAWTQEELVCRAIARGQFEEANQFLLGLLDVKQLSAQAEGRSKDWLDGLAGALESFAEALVFEAEKARLKELLLVCQGSLECLRGQDYDDREPCIEDIGSHEAAQDDNGDLGGPIERDKSGRLGRHEDRKLMLGGFLIRVVRPPSG